MRDRSSTATAATEPAIRTPDRRVRVFVSSTLGELAEERHAVERAITALGLTPVLFEIGARPHPPQDVYRAYLAQSDVFVGLYWQSYGQLAPGAEMSGIEEEFELSAGLPRLLYVKAPAADREPRLADFLQRVSSQASYRPFGSVGELRRLVRDDLAALLSERFAESHAAGPSPGPATRPAQSRAAELVPDGTSSVAGRRRLPAETTSLIGREHDIEEVAGLLTESGTRLVTLTGPGGIGKTRLALAVAERVERHFESGTVFVPLDAISEREVVLTTIGRALGVDLTGAGSPIRALVEQLEDYEWLLVLDNLEQVVDVAADLDRLLSCSERLTLLATSRTVLRLRAEHEYAVPPLSLPADCGTASMAELAELPAVQLFVDRAQAVRHDFTLTPGNATEVAEICERLEGIPLAIELAAARSRLLEPNAILDRLSQSLDALGSGTADMPARQRTLRATVEWSVGLLDDIERSLLETTAVFVDGWTIEASARIAGRDEESVLDLTDALARHSLIDSDETEFDRRWRMLSTVREFVAERLVARADFVDLRRRHAEYFRDLAKEADQPLRGVRYNEWAARLETETANLAETMRWHLAHDRERVPELFRILYPFWSLRDHLRETIAWVDEISPYLDELDPTARATVLWTSALARAEAGDDETALAARNDLLSLIPAVQDPLLQPLFGIAVAWTSPIADDYDGARRAVSASVAELRGRDEPFWTALAVGTLGVLESTVGAYDEALEHVSELRDRAERSNNTWLVGWAQAQLATLAVLRGRPDDAPPLLDEALRLSLDTRSGRGVVLSLMAFARLAFAHGDGSRAAMLAGATEGMRRRTMLRPWPTGQRAEDELVADIREALGDEQFDASFRVGAAFNQREAVAAVRG